MMSNHPLKYPAANPRVPPTIVPSAVAVNDIHTINWVPASTRENTSCPSLFVPKKYAREGFLETAMKSIALYACGAIMLPKAAMNNQKARITAPTRNALLRRSNFKRSARIVLRSALDLALTTDVDAFIRKSCFEFGD